LKVQKRTNAADRHPTMLHRKLLRATLITLGVVVAVTLLSSLTPPGKDALSCRDAEVPGCRAVAGRLVRVDDESRDGSAHLVLLGRSSMSTRLITVVKIPRPVRPAKLPGWGSWVSAIGHPDVGADGRIELVAHGFES
jgi:hypothetical protein